MQAQKHQGRYGEFERQLDYKVKETGWILFNSIYWGIYLIAVTFLLLYDSAPSFSILMETIFGMAFVILGIMVINYGFVEMLHHKLMRKYLLKHS